MELPEKIEWINQQLISHFGIDSDGGGAIWRVVFSDDQIEKRFGEFTDFTEGGLFIRTVKETREVPKYRQWVQQKFILERLVIVPDINMIELPTTKKSYEPIWVFQDKNDNYLPPLFRACKLIIDTVYASQSRDGSLARYKKTKEEDASDTEKRVADYENILFGDESGLKGTTLAGGNAIIVPEGMKS